MPGRTFCRIGHQYGPHNHGNHVGSYYSIYSPDTVVRRLLVHTGLEPENQVLVYDHLPEETEHFSRDVIVKRKAAFQDTLAASMYSKWQQVKGDAVIREIFRPEGGLAYSWSFLHRLLRMYYTDANWEAGESLIWRPLDRTWKAFAVDIVNVVVNGDDWGPEYKGYTDAQDEYGVNELQIWLKVRHEEQPQANLFMVGGSEAAEANLFLNNPAVET